MLITLLGYRKVNFKNDDGEVIAGTSIWIAFPLEGEETEGEESSKHFFRDGTKLPELIPGSQYNASFNNKGRLVALGEIK